MLIVIIITVANVTHPLCCQFSLVSNCLSATWPALLVTRDTLPCRRPSHCRWRPCPRTLTGRTPTGCTCSPAPVLIIVRRDCQGDGWWSPRPPSPASRPAPRRSPPASSSWSWCSPAEQRRGVAVIIMIMSGVLHSQRSSCSSYTLTDPSCELAGIQWAGRFPRIK